MTEFIDNLFLEKTLIFENDHSSIQDEQHAGILNLKANQILLNENIVYEFIFTIDCSGSMSDKCSDGRTKMQHIVHTLTNMINYFKANSMLKVFITVNAFDSKISNIVERTSINNNNIHFILDKINSIKPRDCTNIELALNSVRDTIEQIKNMYSEHNISHIFMTDGEITKGSADYHYLSSLVDRSITNIFIGFGLEHDSVLLNYLSDGENSAYYFIDKLENSGLVYGEILHGIIYKLLYDVQIYIQNGLIYDFKKNIWVSSLAVGEIVGEANKIYHLTSSNPTACSVRISAKKCVDNSEVDIKIFVYKDINKDTNQDTNKDTNEDTNEDTNNDLTKYIYRQRTLQHLFIVKDFLKRRSDNRNVSNDEYLFGFENESEIVSSPFKEEEKILRENLSKFLEELKKYMNDNHLNDDNFLKNLCDDIYITFRTFTSRYGAMFVISRQTTQGTQRCYTVGNTIDTDMNNTKIPKLNLLSLKRSSNYISDNTISDGYNSHNNNDDDNSSIFDNYFGNIQHEVSDVANAPYLTPGATQMMREISNNNIFTQQL
jgi:hypothetical protein